MPCMSPSMHPKLQYGKWEKFYNQKKKCSAKKVTQVTKFKVRISLQKKKNLKKEKTHTKIK